MKSERVIKIRALLESGELVDIGGRTRASAPTTAALVAAFAAIYLIWGSTYLAIRYAVETFPPLLMMGVRHLSAGALLYGWARARGTAAPKLRQWVHAVIIG